MNWHHNKSNSSSCLHVFDSCIRYYLRINGFLKTGSTGIPMTCWSLDSGCYRESTARYTLVSPPWLLLTALWHDILSPWSKFHQCHHFKCHIHGTNKNVHCISQDHVLSCVLSLHNCLQQFLSYQFAAGRNSYENILYFAVLLISCVTAQIDYGLYYVDIGRHKK